MAYESKNSTEFIEVEEIGNFSIVSNECYQNKNLSWKAKGIMIYLQTLKKDWVINKKEVMKHSKGGRDYFNSGWKELESEGYITSTKLRDEKGVITGIKYTVRQHALKSPHTDNPDTDNPDTGKPFTDNPPLINTELNNNLTITNTKDIKETSAKPPSASKVKYEESNHYYQLANYLYQSILRNDPKAKQPNMQTWSDEIRKLVELDERDISEVKDIITFATNDSFWKTNILSTKKLREKFTALYMKSKESPKSYGQKKYQQPQQQVTSKESSSFAVQDWGSVTFNK